MDFTNYRIYINLEDKGCAGMLLEPNKDTRPLEENFIFNFEEGIKRLQETKRGVWLTDRIRDNRSLAEYYFKYFNEKYGIYAIC